LIIDHRGIGYAMVAAAVVGHMFPATRGFRGGKGVATMGGSAFVFQPIVSVILLAVWFAVRKLTKKASLASLVIAVGLPVGVAIKGAPGWEVAAIVGINVLVIVRHLDNIKRLVGGRELSADKRS
jgi:glycerol-3-phosphate acyltransferase PlsY